MPKTGVVIGGSLTGLMHGIMLKEQGYDVTILEQESSASRQGYDAGIRAGPNVVKFLKKYDRTHRAYDISSTHLRYVTKSGATGREVVYPQSLTSWGLIWSILRANYDGMSSKAVPEPPAVAANNASVHYRNGARVINVNNMGDTVQVQLEDVINSSTEIFSANLVIAADGANSAIRKILLPRVERKYAGYVSWRGTVREELLEERFRPIFEKSLVIYRMAGSHILIYTIPTDDGELAVGKRLYNWVWYVTMNENSEELVATMTDIHGQVHYGTVPRDRIRLDIWERQRARGVSVMPEFIGQLLKHTDSPFVTKIHDVLSPQAVFLNEKLFLAGDALAGFRPHIALSTNQAAFDCQLLEEVVKGNLPAKKWEKKVLHYGHTKQVLSRVLGHFQQGNKLALLWNICKLLLLIVGLKIGLLPRKPKMKL